MIFSQKSNRLPMKQLEVKSKEMFSNEIFGELTVIRNTLDEIFFIGKEVAEKLGYVRTDNAITAHCKKVMTCPLEIGGQVRHVNMIPESDVYRLVMKSNKYQAEKFQDWVVEEVLPSIRKRGMYATDDLLNKFLSDPDFAIKLLTQYKDERDKRIEAQHLQKQAEEKIKMLTHVEKMYTATEIAKECGFQSAIALNLFLSDNQVQYKMNDTWVPYSKYSKSGYFHIKQEVMDNGRVIYHRKITQIGREFIIELLNKKAS